MNQPVLLSLFQPVCEHCSVSTQPDLPRGLAVDETATISGTPLEASNVTQYTVTIHSPEQKTDVTTTIVLGVRGACVRSR